MDLKNREWYYIISIYNYYLLIFLLVLIKKFDKMSNFHPDWPELGLIRAELCPMQRKCGFQEPRVVLQSLYIQLLLILITF